MKDNRTSDREGFESEHAKRERRISQQQRRKWADEPIACLPDSVGYRNACTREARLQEQVLLNQFVFDWRAVSHKTSSARCESRRIAFTSGASGKPTVT